MKPVFVVRIADLESGPRTVQFPITDDWLAHALAETEAEPRRDDQGNPVLPGEVELELTKNGRDILVRGPLRVDVTMPCARTLDPAHYQLRTDVFLMLHPAIEPTAVASQQSERTPRRRKGRARPKGFLHGAAPSSPSKAPQGRGGDWSEDPELSEGEAARDTYSGEILVLDDFIREFILLELPMFPLREDLRDERLHSDGFDASSPPPSEPGAGAIEGTDENRSSSEADTPRPLDPRLSPLRELKARLEKKD